MNNVTAGGYVDFARFGALRERAHADGAAALAQIADEFEALFIDLMLAAAREADLGDGLFDSSALDTYREMLDQQLALTMARSQDLGIGAAIRRQFGEFVAGEGDAAAPAGAAPSRPRSVEAPFISGLVPHWPRSAPAPDGAASRAPVDKRDFVASLMPHARAAAAALGLSPRALIAQAALESGWGQHVIRRPDGTSSHNYFGIKAGANWRGDTVTVPTTEYIGGRAVTVRAAFRAYPDAAAAFADYIGFIGDNPRYRGVLAHGANEAQFARQLEAAGYATDPNYASKIMAILSGDDWNGVLGQSLGLSD
jgi:flagellar protein FlgJ